MTLNNQTTTIAYDYETRITQITYPNNSTNTFAYNALDTRAGKVDSGGAKTYKRDGAQATASVLSDGSSAFTPGISLRSSGSSTFLHGDAHGTFSRETNSGQSTTATKQYDAFGMPLASTGASLSPFGFAGRFGYQEDSDSGLKLLGHRYYDASTGRFLTRDPAKDGRNWYGYCGNRPLVGTDASGLACGGYWEEEGKVWKGIGQSFLGVITGPVNAIVGFVNGGYRDPFYGGKLVGAAVQGFIDDINGGWDGDSSSFGHIDGLVMVTVATAAVADGLGGLGEIGDGGGGLGDIGDIGNLNCFVAGTLVAMADGSAKSIERIRPGDRVLTRDERGDETGKIAAGIVSGVSSHRHQGTVLLKFKDGSTAQATEGHRFYVHGRGFVPARDLVPGCLLAESGKEPDVLASIVRISGTLRVYNLEVEGDHTYFVRSGKDWLWVHNGCVLENPDWSAHAVEDVQIEPTGTRWGDRAAATRAAGYAPEEIPDGYVWHHATDPGRMQLVPEYIHLHAHVEGWRLWGNPKYWL